MASHSDDNFSSGGPAKRCKQDRGLGGRRAPAASADPLRSREADAWELRLSNQIDRLENVANRSEAMLSRVDFLEHRCRQLEDRCSAMEKSLARGIAGKESMGSIMTCLEKLDSKLDSVHSSIRSSEISLACKMRSMEKNTEKALKYHELLIRNQKWEYLAEPVDSSHWIRRNFDENYAAVADNFCRDIRACTTSMRQGGGLDGGRIEGSIVLKSDRRLLSESNSAYEVLYHDDILLPHWVEFANALEQYLPFLDHQLPHGVKTSVEISNIQIHGPVCQLLRPPLLTNSSKKLILKNNHLFGPGMELVMEAIQSNPQLEEFVFTDNAVAIEYMNNATRLCVAVKKHPSITKVTLDGCFFGYGSEMFRFIIAGELKLKKLSFSNNGLNPAAINALVGFLASNPCLQELWLNDSGVDDEEALVTALRTNNNLRQLYLFGNNLMADLLYDAVENSDSLNATADSNHTCRIFLGDDNDHIGLSDVNKCVDARKNRACKIFDSIYNKLTSHPSDGQNFDEIRLKLLPNLLAVLQSYHELWSSENSTAGCTMWTSSLDMVYDIVCRRGLEALGDC